MTRIVTMSDGYLFLDDRVLPEREDLPDPVVQSAKQDAMDRRGVPALPGKREDL